MTRPFPSHPRPLARALRAALLGLALAGPVALLAAPPAQAQTAPRSYQIPAGPLDAALTAFAASADITLSFEAAQTRALRTAGLNGEYTPEAGLARLLAGSGLEAVHRGQGNYVLRPAPPTAPGETLLKPMTVTANQLGEITEGSGSYTPGAIATATRLLLTPLETPQSISVVTRQEMDDFNLTSIDKVMEHTPGVSIVTYDSERTEYYARGFAISNFQYDGIPMLRDSAYSAGHTLSDMAIYDRIETLKGATGLLTGTGDPGATINLIRKKPTKDFQGQATLGVGSWQNYRTELDFSGPLNTSGSLRGRAVAAYQDKHSHLDHYRRKTSVFYGTLEADLAPGTLLTVGVDYQNNDPKGSTWGGIPLFDSTGQFNKMPRDFNNGANWNGWQQYTRTAFATLEHYFSNDWVAKLQLNHQINGYDARLAAAASGNPDPATGTGVSLWGPSWYDGKTTSNAIDVYASGPFTLLGRKHELVLGGSFSKRKWESDTYVRQAGYNRSVADYYAWNGDIPKPVWQHSASFGDNTYENGFYATTRLNVSDDLKVIAGSRLLNYRKAELKESDVVVPYLGAVYDLNRNFSAYASYTTIYKPQSAQTKEGKTLDPLEGKNYETGLKGEFFGGRLNASIAYFQLDQDNYAEYTSDTTPTGGTAARAIQGVKTRGYELEISGQLTPRWQLHAGYSHKVSRQQGEKVATLTPENVVTLYTSYKPSLLPGLTLGGGARWQDKTWGEVTDLVNPGKNVDAVAKAYWLLDASARYEFDKHLSATLTVNNLLDKKYYTIFNWYSTYTWGEPRSVMLTMKYKFF
ncbi:MAG: TonB-dependent siderophore receptor [Rhodocyclaceae bacterium]|nr:TonB-dependent siderophore receptor [Rhodocyclaceae bacterium]